MPVLSSFISYRPKRNKGNGKAAIGKISSPFPIRSNNDVNTPHPYASPPVIDIYDERVRTPSPEPQPSLERPSIDYYSTSTTSSPQMRLEVDINPTSSPLLSWFPPDLLRSDPFTVNLEEKAPKASGSTSYNSNGADTAGPSGLREEYTEYRPSYEEDDQEEMDDSDEIDAEEVLAGMDISYGDLYAPEDVQGIPSKRPAPAPIKIPNVNIHGPKVQLLHSTEPSRPTSQISSPELSAVSGTSFARALMGNSFFLSSDARGSKYRSGFSTLTRMDSATLPGGEYGLINSPYWRGSTASSLSPPVPPEPVPPVPDNADQVYVPPQVERHSVEPRRSRSMNASSAAPPPPEKDHKESPKQDGEEAKALRRISKISETTTSLQSTVQDHAALAEPEPAPEPRSHSPAMSTSSVDRGKSRRYSMVPEYLKSGADILSEGVASPSALSDPPSSPGRELDNVLDYYQLEEALEQPPGVYRLPFSPIREETSSQLSPPAPYSRPGSQTSSIRTPGRDFFGAGPSATTGGVRVDWSLRRTSEAQPGSRDSISKQLLPIGERFGPGQTPSPTSPTLHGQRPSFSQSSSSTNLPDNYTLLPPPPFSSLFNRGRSGSAPSPIQVVRDSRDLNSYTIMVTPRTGDSGEQTASTDDSDMLRQDFPETPNAFSPGFSPGPGSVAPPRDGSYSAIGEPGSRTPMTAFLPGNNGIRPSLAQQMLLTRAATSVHGARHSRQNSLSKLVWMNGRLPPPASRPTSAIVKHSATQGLHSSDESLAKDETQSDTAAHSNASSTSLNSVQEQSQVAECPDSPVIRDLGVESGSIHAQSPPSIPQEVPSATSGSVSPETTVTVAPASPAASSHTEPPTGLAYMHSHPSSALNSPLPEGKASGSHHTPLESPRILPPPLPSPVLPVVLSPVPPPPPLPEKTSNYVNTSSTDTYSSPSPRVEQAPIPPTQTMIPAPAPAHSSTPILSPPTPLLSSPLARRPTLTNPPAPQTQLASAQPSASSLYAYALDSAPTGSPPPYYAVVNNAERRPSDAVTPTTGGSYDRFGTPISPPAGASRFNTNSDPPSIQGQNTPHASRHRPRPGVPVGPRRPSTQHPQGSLPPSTWAHRERNGSVSSITSNMASGRRVHHPPLTSPKFPVPSPKFRGFTMDAAKWTFTSTQLQDIVSRAIRQSSEASFIRLLQLETLDEEIPDEIDRLEALKSQIKANYKNFSRRRATLLESLTSCLDSSDPDAKARALRLADDLRDLSANLDKLTEDLNTVNEQLSQVNHITQLHSTSALAMALRKLNGSFLKQFQEAQELRLQVSSLEAERDEAWKQAEKVANDYDDLSCGLVESPSSESKLLRITVSRKTSATKASLRSASRVSQRFSVGSISLRGASLTTPNSIRTTFHEEIPPVPPLPKHRPGEIKTNLPLRHSVITATETPNSDIRAMVRVTEELYNMLGIPLNDRSSRSRRSRSVIGLPGEGEAGSPSYSYYDPPPNTGRRNSLPGSAAPLPDTYSAMAVDVILNSDQSGWI